MQADALQVQSVTSELSTLITGEQVAQLATNGRNVTALAALGMGVSNTLPAFSGVNALTSANGISFNGTRVSHKSTCWMVANLTIAAAADVSVPCPRSTRLPNSRPSTAITDPTTVSVLAGPFSW